MATTANGSPLIKAGLKTFILTISGTINEKPIINRIVRSITPKFSCLISLFTVFIATPQRATAPGWCIPASVAAQCLTVIPPYVTWAQDGIFMKCCNLRECRRRFFPDVKCAHTTCGDAGRDSSRFASRDLSRRDCGHAHQKENRQTENERKKTQIFHITYPRN